MQHQSSLISFFWIIKDFSEKMPHFNHFPRPGEIDPYRLMQPQSWFQLSLSDYDVHDKCPRKQNKPVVTGPHAWLPLNELLGKQRMFALSIFARKGGGLYDVVSDLMHNAVAMC